MVHARANGVRQRRQRSRLLGVGVAAAITLVAGIGAAGADTNQTSSDPVPRAARAPDEGVDTTRDTTTTIQTTETSTTVPAATTTAAPTPATTTTTTAASDGAATASPVASRVRPTAEAFVFEVSPPNRDPGRIYISARGQATSGYVSRLILTWGDGSQARIFNYPASSCRAPGGSQTHDVEVADDNHVYSAPSASTVRLTVLVTSCDGAANDTAVAQVPVTYPSSPPD